MQSISRNAPEKPAPATTKSSESCAGNVAVPLAKSYTPSRPEWLSQSPCTCKNTWRGPSPQHRSQGVTERKSARDGASLHFGPPRFSRESSRPS